MSLNFFTSTKKKASQHERCPPVILISHILYTVNWNNCVQFIPYQDISQAMEWLTWTIIMLVDKPEVNKAKVRINLFNFLFFF